MSDEDADAQEAAERLGAEHAPCPCCPVEVRNLAAVAHNTVVKYPHLEDLRRACAALEPLMQRHFLGVRNVRS